MRHTILLALLGTTGCLAGYAPPQDQPTTADLAPLASTVDAGVIQPPPPPQSTSAEEVAKFGNCMTLADWTSSGMNDVQNQTTIGDAGECYSCHLSGMYNVALTKDPNNNFNLMHTMPWIFKLAQATTNADGSFADIAPTERIRDRGSEAGHPVYTLSTPRQQALDGFFQLTYAHYKAGNCIAPAVAPPVDGGI